MKHLARATLALALLSAVILGACTAGPLGIFESLSLETPVDNGTEAFSGLTPNFVVRLGADYYAGVGTLWKRPVGGGAWNPVPGTPDGMLATSAATDGSALFVLFTDGDSSVVKEWDGSAWAPDLATTGIGTMKPDALHYADTTLFLSVGATDTEADPDVTSANIHSGLGFATAAFATAPTGGIVKALVHDSLTYYSAHADDVYSGDADAGGLTTMALQPAIGTVTALLARGADVVVAAGASGSVAVWDGSAWTPHVIDSAAYLSDLVEVPAHGGGTVILAAARGFGTKVARGYYEVSPLDWSVNEDHDLVTTTTNYQTTLEDLGIVECFWDAADGILFACTVGDGLWSNHWNGTSWSGWNRE
ncbi:MAG: hypothetical protein JXA15_11000 [Spirochaetales bacterium]|nr:hypothetical protein [Spirochaetales bacterium]